jgi:uncharacterized alpha-E superfamily protein
MLSRVADSIYWMSRYVERAENVARFIDVTLNLSLDMGQEVQRQWSPLIFTTGDQQNFEAAYPNASQHNVIQFLTFDDRNPNSIISCLRAGRENARIVRDMISTEMWEEFNKFFLLVKSADQKRVLASPFEFFQLIKEAGFVLSGATEATMSQGEAWHFRNLGRLLERADKTSRILDVKYYLLLPSRDHVGKQFDVNQWASLLKSAGALEMYRKAYGRITPQSVAQFLLLDREFPRSVLHCLVGAEASLLAITGGTLGRFRNPAEQRLGRLRSELEYANIHEIISGGLHEFIDGLQTDLNNVGDAIFDTFFSIKPVHGDSGTQALEASSA